jgi:enolase
LETPGTPDIQEILICATGSKTIKDAIETNLSVHKELRSVLEKTDPSFTNGRGDEGGWAPKLTNERALELSAKACENLGFTLGKEVSLGVDFASSTQWDEEKKMYVYNRAGFENSSKEQIEFASKIIEKYKLVFAEDAVHEEAFEDIKKFSKKQLVQNLVMLQFSK